MRILIADDDPVSRRLLERTLLRLGHDVVAVTNGTDAIAGLQADGAPQMAVLDWMMPGADGLTVCRTIRARPRPAPYVYIILLTARDGRADMVEALEAEADDFLIKPFDKMELRGRLRCGERVLGFQEALRHQATHDNLTGLWNRGLVMESLDRTLAYSKRAGQPVTITMVDLDHFKQINDTYGHAAGDAVLRQAADRIKEQVRGGDLVGRYGGEEFLMVLPATDTRSGQQVAGRVRSAMCLTPMVTGNDALQVTASFGLASTVEAGYDAAELLHAADTALYRAKALGRNRVEIAPDLQQLQKQTA